MRRRWFAVAATVLAGVGIWSWAQPAPPSPGSLLPAGALLYLEARDFAALLSEWDASPAKAEWLQSANYRVFSNSRLLQRLAMEQQEFAQAAGVPPDYALLKGLAGTDTAFAVYDIGNLEVLYVSRVGTGWGAQSSLWQTRATFQPRTAGGRPYFVKTDASKRRTAAFAFAEDLLIAGTREDLVAGVLELLANQPRQRLQEERWFSLATASQQQGARDVRMVMNLARLAATPYYRSYYVHGNAAEARQFSSGIADLERTAGEIRERRTFLRAAAGDDRTGQEPAVARLLALVTDDASVFRAWASPGADRAAAAIAERMLVGSAANPAPATSAPWVDTSQEQFGREEDLETRIDERIQLESLGQGVPAAIARLTSGNPPSAMLQMGWSRQQAGDPFVLHDHAIVLLGAQDWNGEQVREAIGQAASGLWRASGSAPLAWQSQRAANREYHVLSSLAPIAVAVNGPVLLLSSRAERMPALLARLGQGPAATGAVYAGGFRHSLESPRFLRMMTLIDFPRRPASQEEGRDPFFFSENLASLSRTLGKLQSVSIEEHDRGAQLTQQIVYRMGQ